MSIIFIAEQFMEFDEDHSGDIGNVMSSYRKCTHSPPLFLGTDIMELKRMMEKLGQAKTHLELKKMIQEVDTTKKGKDNK